MDSFPGVSGRDVTPNSNGHCSTSEFRQGIVPVENGIHVRQQSLPLGRGTPDVVVGEIGGRKSAELVLITGPTVEPKRENGHITRTYGDKCFSSPPPNYSIPPPPSYSSQFSPQYVYSSSSSTSKITESSPPRFVVSLDQDSMSRPESHQSDERSSRASATSTPSHLKTISPSAMSASRATNIDQAQHQYLHHRSPSHRISDFRNTSSQSSAPNSSTEFEPETTDFEVNHALGSSSSGRRNTPHRETRPLNNTPVNCYQTDTAGPDPDSLLCRRPPRLNFEPMTYDSDSNFDHVDKAETAGAPWRIASTIPPGNGAEVWTSGADSLLARRPPQAGLRRPPGPASITRPFGHGSVTVTPLYRAPKTPPAERHNTVAAGVTVRIPEATQNVAPRGTVTVKTPELRRGGMSAALSARSPDGQREGAFGSRTVPTVSVTPCITDREIDISVCQSDVTVYDNVIDIARV